MYSQLYKIKFFTVYDSFFLRCTWHSFVRRLVWCPRTGVVVVDVGVVCFNDIDVVGELVLEELGRLGRHSRVHGLWNNKYYLMRLL